MINTLLVNLVDKYLGKGVPHKEDYAYHCPKCKHHKPKLSINFTENTLGENKFQCWVCGFKGRSLIHLFKKVGLFSKIKDDLLPLLKVHSGYTSDVKEINHDVELPKEYKTLYLDTSIYSKHVNKYLKKRGVTTEDIIKYNIGYCETGLYKDMVIVPSYDEYGKLNFWVGRSIKDNAFIKHGKPECSQDIIFNELLINWDLPIFLCEGVFDAIAIKRNAIPLLGKNISDALMMKIITSNVRKIIIVLDMDAIDKALKYCDMFMSYGIDVYYIKLESKDPSEMGFEEFTKLLPSIKVLNSSELLKEKINKI